METSAKLYSLSFSNVKTSICLHSYLLQEI